MLIGHLPAGYLASTALLRRIPPARRRGLITAALVGSVLPDLDLLYFYGVDSSVHHHAFPPHWPLVWLTGLLASSILIAITEARVWRQIGLAVSAAALLHCALDSIAGSVRWLAPFSAHETTLITIPATYDSWIASFMTHWTFSLELALLAVAGVVWALRRRLST